MVVKVLSFPVSTWTLYCVNYPRGHTGLRKTEQYKEFLPSVDLEQQQSYLLLELWQFLIFHHTQKVIVLLCFSLDAVFLTQYRPLIYNRQMTRQRQQLFRNYILILRSQHLSKALHLWKYKGKSGKEEYLNYSHYQIKIPDHNKIFLCYL